MNGRYLLLLGCFAILISGCWNSESEMNTTETLSPPVAHREDHPMTDPWPDAQ